MRLAIIYSDRRGKFVAKGFEDYCDVVEIDLSELGIHNWQRWLSAMVSFRTDRKLWKNDFYRNPLSVYFRKKAGEAKIRKISAKVDAVLQFGLMNTYDYSLFGQPRIFYYLDGAYDPNNPYWYCPRFGKWFSDMQRRAYTKATGIFTFSKWARKQHIEQLGIPAQKVTNVGWGPCLNLEDACPKDVFNDPPNFLFIGRNSPRKGFDILVTAFLKVQKLYPEVILHCVGVSDGEYQGRRINGMVFHGYRRGEELKRIIKASDIFVLPSRYERAGHVTIETMCYGLVPIVTNTAGSSDPVSAGGCGSLIPPEDPDAMVDAMTCLVENKEKLREFSARAFEEAHRNWTWKMVCKRMIEHIEATL